MGEKCRLESKRGFLFKMCKNLMLERDKYSLELGDVCTPDITMHNVSSQIWSPSSGMRLSCSLGHGF